MEGQDSLPSVLGPLSASVFGVKAFTKAVIDAKPWLKDPLAVHKAWDQQEYDLVDRGGGRELVFAIMWNDGNVMPHPPIIRALEITRDALIAAGHKGMFCAIPKLYIFSLLFPNKSHRMEAIQTCRAGRHCTRNLDIGLRRGFQSDYCTDRGTRYQYDGP